MDMISCDKGLKKHSSPQGFYGEKGADLYVDILETLSDYR